MHTVCKLGWVFYQFALYTNTLHLVLQLGFWNATHSPQCTNFKMEPSGLRNLPVVIIYLGVSHVLYNGCSKVLTSLRQLQTLFLKLTPNSRQFTNVQKQ